MCSSMKIVTESSLQSQGFIHFNSYLESRPGALGSKSVTDWAPPVKPFPPVLTTICSALCVYLFPDLYDYYTKPSFNPCPGGK